MEIDKWRTKKKAVCKTARRAHSQKASFTLTKRPQQFKFKEQKGKLIK